MFTHTGQHCLHAQKAAVVVGYVALQWDSALITALRFRQQYKQQCFLWSILFKMCVCMTSGKWAWLRLGLYQVRHDDPTIAVASFQAALRADPRDK